MQFNRTFIKDWRLHRGLSQERLAERVGISKASVSRIENAKQGYTQVILELIADALQCEPADLIMRRPGQHEIWSLISTLKPEQERQAVRVLKAMVEQEDAAA